MVISMHVTVDDVNFCDGLEYTYNICLVSRSWPLFCKITSAISMNIAGPASKTGAGARHIVIANKLFLDHHTKFKAKKTRHGKNRYAFESC